ncbi:hypothetical protein XELAEV_18002225mg [Xenopus laevis]|nr:hypothetical protein XELAEV_18002225mg [Xenopus laevis]
MHNVLGNFAVQCPDGNSMCVTVGCEVTPIVKSIRGTPNVNVSLEKVNEVIHSGEHQKQSRGVCNKVAQWECLKGEAKPKPCTLCDLSVNVYKSATVCKTEPGKCTSCSGPGHMADNCPYERSTGAITELIKVYDQLCVQLNSGGESQSTESNPLERQGYVQLTECVVSENRPECADMEKGNMAANGDKPHGVTVVESKAMTPVLHSMEGVLQSQSVCLTEDVLGPNTSDAKCELFANTECVTEFVEGHPIYLAVGKTKMQSMHDGNTDAKVCVSSLVNKIEEMEVCVVAPIETHVSDSCGSQNKLALKYPSKSDSHGSGMITWESKVRQKSKQNCGNETPESVLSEKSGERPEIFDCQAVCVCEHSQCK